MKSWELEPCVDCGHKKGQHPWYSASGFCVGNKNCTCGRAYNDKTEGR